MTDPAWESPSSADRLPPEVPDFELIRLIGEGGFGQVWLATNRATGRLRAVKVIPLHSPGTTDPAGREIASITRLEANFRRRHPNLSAIDHVGTTADHLYYVMDPADDVSGGPPSLEAGYRPATLQSRLQTGPLPPEQCWRYARQLLAGLAFLHEAGMVHRDVKPANCLFVEGQLKLADFGLLTEADPQTSRLGTLKYMPHDGRMDARADVYAAGLVIYEMITGLPAESFPRPGERAIAAVEDPVLCALNHLALRACQRDPLERFRDADQMLLELERCQGESAAGKRSRRRLIAAVAGLVVASSLAGVGIWASRWRGVHVNFITRPFGATIYLDHELQKHDGRPYRTPCTIEDLPPRVHHVQFRHDEWDAPLDAGPHDFARERRIVEHWPTQ